MFTKSNQTEAQSERGWEVYARDHKTFESINQVTYLVKEGVSSKEKPANNSTSSLSSSNIKTGGWHSYPRPKSYGHQVNQTEAQSEGGWEVYAREQKTFESINQVTDSKKSDHMIKSKEVVNKKDLKPNYKSKKQLISTCMED